MRTTTVNIKPSYINIHTVVEYINKEHVRIDGLTYKVPETCSIKAGYRDRDHKFKIDSLENNHEYWCNVTVTDQAITAIEFIEEYMPREERDGTQTHESWGTITMSRPHNSGFPLFMSEDDDTRAIVDINISQAIVNPMNQGVCSDKYYVRDGKNILSVRLSYAQWLKFISNQTGTQTPCTITTKENNSIRFQKGSFNTLIDKINDIALKYVADNAESRIELQRFIELSQQKLTKETKDEMAKVAKNLVSMMSTSFLYSLETAVEKWTDLMADRDINKEAKQ